MKLEPTVPQPNRPWMVTSGSLKILAALALLWSGLNSLLIGVAYHLQRGAALPRMVGVILIVAAWPLLFNGVRQVVRYARAPEPERIENL